MPPRFISGSAVGLATMPKRSAQPTVIHLTGPIVLDFGNGLRLQIGPADALPARSAQVATGARRGRKPSPATAALAQAMQADASSGKPRSRQGYLQILREGGHQGSEASAGLIVAREAKRAFGMPLGRGKKARKAKNGRGGGRKASPATALLRNRLTADHAKGEVKEAGHYVRWVLDQPGVKLGIKGVRPIVYRELRAIKATS